MTRNIVESNLYATRKRINTLMEMDYQKIYNDRRHKILQLQGEEKDYSVLKDYFFFEDIPLEDFKSILRAQDNRRGKKKRYNEEIWKILQFYRFMKYDGNVVFGTLTLDDYSLNLKQDTLMKKISKYMKKHYNISIVNPDYTPDTERLHFHFIAHTFEDMKYNGHKSNSGIPMLNLVNEDYKMGFEPNIEIMNLNDKNKTRNYLMKMANHSTKESTKEGKMNRFRVYENDFVKVLFGYGKNRTQEK